MSGPDAATTGRVALAERLALVRCLPAAGRPVLAGLLVAHALRATLPVAVAVATGVLVGRLVAMHPPTGHPWAAVASPLVMIVVLLLAGQVAGVLVDPLNFVATRRIDGWVRRKVFTAALQPAGIEHLDFRFHDDVRLATTGWLTNTIGAAAVAQLSLLFRGAGLLLSAAVLARYSVILAVLVFVPLVGTRRLVVRMWGRMRTVLVAGATEERRMDYWAGVAAGPDAAKEVRIFGLAGWVVDQHERHARLRLGPIWRERRRIVPLLWLVFFLTVGTAVLGIAGLALGVVDDRVSAGELAMYLGAVWSVLGGGAVGNEPYVVQYGLPGLAALRRLPACDTPAPASCGSGDSAAEEVPPSVTAPLVRFEAIGFGYPGSDREVLADLDLTVEPGEVLAVVGLNGAGKSTLVKLLAGLYQPDRGRVTADGIDVRDLGADRWRRHLSVVFQDFIRYELPLRDNIALGAPHRGADEALLAAAAEQAGLLGLIDRLPAGWDTPLARSRTGGVDLSGGQWQRVAVARALFAVGAGADIVVLDEPTAHLDVRAEFDVFERVLAAVRPATVLFISHRMSMVRRADRIVVLDGGRITETGTHAELVGRDGGYARMFALQAARFARTGAEP